MLHPTAPKLTMLGRKRLWFRTAQVLDEIRDLAGLQRCFVGAFRGQQALSVDELRERGLLRAATEEELERRFWAPAGSDSDSDSSSAGSLKAAAQQLRARGAIKGSGGGDGSEGGSSMRVAIQTSRNTVDVRGLSSDEAAVEVQAAVLSAPAGLAIFVIHGVGTGRVRAEVLRVLRRMPQVARLETEEKSAGGCTVVYVK